MTFVEFVNSYTGEDAQRLIKDPQIIALLITGFLETLRRIFQAKAIIHWGFGHGFSFSVPQTQGGVTLLHTGSISVRNDGRVPAKDVEFYFNYKPEHFQIWPVIQHSVENTPDGRFLIKIPFLKEGETLSIEIIQSRGDIPNLVNVRAMEGRVKEVAMGKMRIFAPWINLTLGLICLAGIYQILVWLIIFVQQMVS